MPAGNCYIQFCFYLILVVLGLCYCERAFSSWGERGLLCIAVSGLFIAGASLVEYRLQVRGLQAPQPSGSVVVAYGLCCSTHGIWNLSGPGIEPVYSLHWQADSYPLYR